MKTAISLLLLLLSACAIAGVDPSNKFKLGDGANTDKVIEANKGSGSTNPKLRYQASGSKWQFSNDGSTYTDFGGSGSSEVQGVGFNLFTSTDNAGFEDGATTWTASGGSFTDDSSTPMFGSHSGSFDASALNQTLTSAAKTVVRGLYSKGQRCAGVLTYTFTGSNGDYKLQAYDGSSVLAEVSLDASSTPVDAFVRFDCPSSGTMALRIIANVSNPGAIRLDGSGLTKGVAYIGYDVISALLSHPIEVGIAYFAPTASCLWTRNNATYVAPNTTAACPGPTVEVNDGPGEIQTTDVDLPNVTVNNMIEGVYEVKVDVLSYNSAAGRSSVQVHDGTTGSGEAQTFSNGNVESLTLHSRFTYTHTGVANKTFALQVKNAVGTANIPNDTADTPTRFIITRLRSSKEKITYQGGLVK